MESLGQLLRRTIRSGTPLYNQGDREGCYELYARAAEHALESPSVAASRAVGTVLRTAVNESKNKVTNSEKGFAEAAWILRRAFDEILATHGSKKQLKLVKEKSDDASDASTQKEDDFYWQDEKVEKRSDIEKGQALANVGLILQSSEKLTQPSGAVGTELVEELMSIMSFSRVNAVEKLEQLCAAGFLVQISSENSASPTKQQRFLDGPQNSYKFVESAEKLAESLKDHEAKIEASMIGSPESILVEALKVWVAEDTLAQKHPLEQQASFSRRSRRVSLSQPITIISPQEQDGMHMADDLATLISRLEIKERRHNLKKYPDCFVGQDAVDIALQSLPNEKSTAATRDEIVDRLNKLLEAGLIQHVTQEHVFKDKALFYRITPAIEVQSRLDSLRSKSSLTDEEKVDKAALEARTRQFKLDVNDILNSFYGCDSKEGWDLVDLQNWRNNMKRWGFGRREDQDDGMVDQLSPLLLQVDPEKWDVSGDPEWESPFGILAQIAIFDQVSRSAFRGTADAFAWDRLAIRATKVALAKGYFETAYKSTLNQFLILLPLEHSEDWEDQKLGVSLIMNLLSTVSIQDVGISDYEIVKRLEFSKRLTTAFLEHAQVIAKFKRYPHRNRALGRSATLEERVWLASDLVPRWAQSQSPEEARTVLQLPVIPLKRLTRGR